MKTGAGVWGRARVLGWPGSFRYLPLTPARNEPAHSCRHTAIPRTASICLFQLEDQTHYDTVIHKLE
jgi:hypothetical protein